ncbi:hypothetical protein D3C71_1757000 [compost metagenome]
MRDALRTLQHRHDLAWNRHGHDARSRIDAADHTAWLVAAHQRLEPPHLQIGLLHSVAQQQPIGALHGHVDLRPHQGPGVTQRCRALMGKSAPSPETATQ